MAWIKLKPVDEKHRHLFEKKFCESEEGLKAYIEMTLNNPGKKAKDGIPERKPGPYTVEGNSVFYAEGSRKTKVAEWERGELSELLGSAGDNLNN